MDVTKDYDEKGLWLNHDRKYVLVWILEAISDSNLGTLVRIRNDDTNEVFLEQCDRVLRFNAELLGTYKAVIPDKFKAVSQRSSRAGTETGNLDSFVELLDPVDDIDLSESSVRAYRWHSSRRHGEDPNADSCRQSSRRPLILDSEQWRWQSGLTPAVPSYDGEKRCRKTSGLFEEGEGLGAIHKGIIAAGGAGCPNCWGPTCAGRGKIGRG